MTCNYEGETSFGNHYAPLDQNQKRTLSERSTDDMCALGRFTTARKWGTGRCKEFILSAQAYAISVHQSILQHDGDVTASELCRSLGVNIISQPDSETLYQYLHFADYDSELQTIYVNEAFVERVAHFIVEYAIIPIAYMPTSFREVVIAHEMFHFLEGFDRDWSRRYLPSWCRRNHVSGSVSFVQRTMASEVGAMHFSRLQSRILFSPCVFEEIAMKLNRSGF